MTASSSRRVVLLVGADGDTATAAVLGSESTPLSRILAHAGEAIELSMVSWTGQDSVDGLAAHARLDGSSQPIADRVLRALGAYALRRRFDGFPIGRLLNSIGPVAPGRVFWRAAKQHPEALRLLRSADVAIATDLDSTKAAWIAVHRGWVGEAYYDHRALASMRGGHPGAAPFS